MTKLSVHKRTDRPTGDSRDVYIYILREKSLAIYFGDSKCRNNRNFDFIISKIYVDKRL